MYDPNMPPPAPGMMQTMGAPAQGFGQAIQQSPQERGNFMQSMFGPDFNRRGYIDSIRQWIGSRPNDPAGMDAWRAQMPSPFGGAQAPAGPAPYPVTQLPNQIAPSPVTQAPGGQGFAVGEPHPGAVSYPSQGPVKQQGFGAPQPPRPPQAGQWPPQQSRPAMGGFFGTRKGR